MAPEIFEQNKEGPLSYGKSCDIFSIGVVLHVIVFGYGPFKGKNYGEVYNANRTCLIPFETSVYQDLHADVLALLQGMLAKTPQDRITMDEIKANAFFEHKLIFKEKPAEDKLSESRKRVDSVQQEIRTNNEDMLSLKQQLDLKPKEEERD